MAQKTISDVSRELGISTRMLRYYEQAGLVRSLRRPDYAYRVYDAEAVLRLKQILVLRKLRVPVKQIERILRNQDAATAIDVFRQSVEELGAEIDALQLIRKVLAGLMEVIGRESDARLDPALLTDGSVAGLIASLSPPEQLLKGDRTMDALNRADQKLSQIKDVRIVHLPPSWVAAYHYRGEDSEAHAQDVVNRFVLDSGLLRVKPDIRHFGFNNPARGGDDDALPGYEMWVTVPENFPVPEPLVRKRFLGGLYAAHAIEFGAFDHWRLLGDWVTASPDYALDFESPRCEPSDPEMDQCLEEQLNYFGNVQAPAFDISRMQLDLLLPIR